VSDRVVTKQHTNSQTSDSNSLSNTIIAHSHTKTADIKWYLHHLIQIFQFHLSLSHYFRNAET